MTLLIILVLLPKDRSHSVIPFKDTSFIFGICLSACLAMLYYIYKVIIRRSHAKTISPIIYIVIFGGCWVSVKLALNYPVFAFLPALVAYVCWYSFRNESV